MKYIALIYSEPREMPPYGTPEFEAAMAEWGKVNKAFEDGGVMVAGEALEPPTTATRVEVRDGKTTTMDGPFAETKEQLGGYYVLDCKDLDEAIRYAAMIPVARFGTIEVRPIMNLGG